MAEHARSPALRVLRAAWPVAETPEIEPGFLPRPLLNPQLDDDLQRLVARVAAEQDFEVIATKRGAEVHPLALSKSPALIILDVRFPDMDGRDVLARLKRDPKTAPIPVLVWSGSVEGESDRRVALELGAEDYVEKLDVVALVAKAQRILLRFPSD